VEIEETCSKCFGNVTSFKSGEALTTFFKAIEGKNVPQAIKEGQSKLISMPSGG
jgi:ribosomal protein L12E/L44/L45/RPP1/RPP2